MLPLSNTKHRKRHQPNCTLLRYDTYIPSANSLRQALTLAACLYLPTSHTFSIPSYHQTGEHIVQAQLTHYKNGDVAKVYELCSPWFQDVTGSLNDFEEAINQTPFNLLLGHKSADILLETLPDTPKKDQGDIIQAACYLVCVKPGIHAPSHYPVWFWWETSRHLEDLDNGKAEGEWKVDCVMPDFDDLEFEAESLAQYLGDGDDDFDGFLFDMNFDPDEEDHSDDDDDNDDDF